MHRGDFHESSQINNEFFNEATESNGEDGGGARSMF